MRFKFKRTILSLIGTTIFTLSLPITALAVGDNGNSGSGSGSTGSNGAYTWTSLQEGYRLTIVDNTGKRVSNSVDLVYHDLTKFNFGSGNKDLYTNLRNEPLKSSASNKRLWQPIYVQTLKDQNVIGSIPPQPIHYNSGSNAQAGGFDFKEWFLAGKDFLSSIPQPPANIPSTTTTGGLTRPDKNYM